MDYGPAQGLSASIFSDIDGDGLPELIAGRDIYDARFGTDRTPTARQFEGSGGDLSAMADFNFDGKPDLAAVQNWEVSYHFRIIDLYANNIVAGPFAAGGIGLANGGPPLVDDLDADGVPDVGVVSSTLYCVYSLKCSDKPAPPECDPNHPGALWCKEIQDRSSGSTGSTSFDFNEDGIPEVVYRDECWLRVIDGLRGDVLFARTMTSSPLAEGPVVADVDNDGHAELIVPSDSYVVNCDPVPEFYTLAPWTGPTKGIYVFGDAQRRWPTTRKLWTSPSYHVTDINDDLTVPRLEKPSWKTHNTYRRNRQPSVPPPWVPDFTAAATSLPRADVTCPSQIHIEASICNRGSDAALAGVSGAFYDGDPRGASMAPLCTATTQTRLMPGVCEVIGCDWWKPRPSGSELWFRADDDGTHFPVVPECHAGNDVAHLGAYRCGEGP